MIRKHYDKILMGLSLALLLGVFALAAFRPEPKSITEYVNIPVLRPNNTYEVTPMVEPDLSVPQWEEPVAQSAGVEWVFDVFTPPVIYFNPQTETFTVFSRPEAPPPPWPVVLMTIREELYRVQLMGYVGEAGDYRISLENRETGELILAREGQTYPDLQIEVRKFTTEEVRVSGFGQTDVFQTVARVVLYDQRLDREVILRSEEKTKSDESVAVFQAKEAPEIEFVAKEGDTFSYLGSTYTVEEITPPARASVTRSGGEDEPETKTLTAIEPEMGPGTGASSGQTDSSQPGSGTAGETDSKF